MDVAKKRHYQGQKGNTPIVDYNYIRPHDTHEASKAKVEFFIAKQVGEHLCKTYPNREWGVDTDTRNQILVISCPSLSTRLGYRIHMRRDTLAQLLPRAARAAGEILERYGITRGQLIDPRTMETFKRDARGDVVHKDAAGASRL